MEKKYNCQFDFSEMNILRGGLGHYKDYLEKIMKKEKPKRREELKKTYEKIDRLEQFINDTIF